MRLYKPTLLLFLLPLLLSTTASAQPAARFSEYENRLLDSKTLSLSFHVIASGAVEANLRGRLNKAEDGSIELTVAGVFAGQEMDLIAALAGDRFEYGHRSDPQTAAAPAELWESLVIGLTRMGILHNIASLMANTMPDHADGGVAEWVTITNIDNEDESFAFDIVVAGTPSGAATLAFDLRGNPGIRHQTVNFPGGEMRVVETYLEAHRSE